MGRKLTITHISICDEGDDPLYLEDNGFVEMMEKKHNVEYKWIFYQHGGVGFAGHKDVYGLIEDIIKSLLDTAKIHNRKISGTLSYQEETSGGSTHGLVYIAKDYTAMINSFDTDVDLDNLGQLDKQHTTIIIGL
jgi:ribosome-interacting GTPase 1